MFEYLESFDKILVTGPQRTGTRICAEMIMRDLDKPMQGRNVLYVDEALLNFDSLAGLCDVMADERLLVVQCPALARYVHHFGHRDDVAVVWMRRDYEDIVASQRRVDWCGGTAELLRYDRTLLARAFTPDCVSAAVVKNEFWQQIQKPRIKHAYEVEFESLAEHRLWVPAERRTDFEWFQTSEEQGEHHERKRRRINEAQNG